MDLPVALSRLLAISPKSAEQVAWVILSGVLHRVAADRGSQAAVELSRAVPELPAWHGLAGMTTQVDSQRFGLALGKGEARAVAIIAEVLYSAGAEPAVADLVGPVVRTFLEERMGSAAVNDLAQSVPLLAGTEATPVPSGRNVLVSALFGHR